MPSSGFVPFISSLAKPSENIHLCHSSSSSSSSSSCRCLSGGVHTGVYSHSHTHTHTHTHIHTHTHTHTGIYSQRWEEDRFFKIRPRTMHQPSITLKQTLYFVMLSQREDSRAGQAGLLKKDPWGWQKHKLSLLWMSCNWHHLAYFPATNSQWAQRWTSQELPDVQALRMRLTPWMKGVNPSGSKSQQRRPPGQTDLWLGGHHAQAETAELPRACYLV